jgi:hypothetical protein
MRLLISQPQMRERLGVAAEIHARQFTASRSIPQLEDLYRQLIDSRSALTAAASS